MNTFDLKNRKIEDIMTRDVITIHMLNTAEKINEIFEANSIHHIPVLDDDEKLVGIVSRKDLSLLKHWATKFGVESAIVTTEFLLRTQLAKDIMSKDLVTVSPNKTIGQCVDIFKENLFHSLPVISNGKLVGIVTPYDIINTVFYPKELYALNTVENRLI